MPRVHVTTRHFQRFISGCFCSLRRSVAGWLRACTWHSPEMRCTRTSTSGFMGREGTSSGGADCLLEKRVLQRVTTFLRQTMEGRFASPKVTIGWMFSPTCSATENLYAYFL